MTRDEAVKMLQATRLMLMDGANQPISDLYYALDMAIEALEQTEPTNSEKPNNCKTHTEGVWNAGFKTGYDKGYKDAQKVKDSQDLVKDLVKAFCEDGTWLERQGVYTLTLAEAKQRAVDIIESVTQTETQNSNLTFEKADERCKGCNHYKLTCDLFSEICRFEPKDEPQTDGYISGEDFMKIFDEPQTERSE